jgi:hypothetical protein
LPRTGLKRNVPLYQTHCVALKAVESGSRETPIPPTADPEPLGPPARGWAQWLGMPISAAVFGSATFQLSQVKLGHILSLLPVSPSFWLVFVVAYFTTTMTEWLIFRRLWGIPASGFLALTRKRISNEIVLGYLGEVYFYAWARKRAHMVGAPFGAIKDVAILSALCGNALTLVLVAAAWPLFTATVFGVHAKSVAWSLAVLLVTFLGAALFRRHLFSLPPRDLRFVIIAHCMRIVATTGLAALMWHIVLPQVALGWWLLLGALRLLLSRFPFVPNKDFIFAAIAVLLVGHDTEIAALMTMIASLLLITHLLLGLLLVGPELVSNRTSKAW